MRLLFSSLLLLISFSTEAITCKAYVRDSKHNLVIRNVELTDSTSDETFTGRYFKVVKAKDDEPVKLNDPDLSLRACTVYHHLSVARKYFLDHFQDRHVRNLRQLTVRIEMPYSFIDSSHFMEESIKTYNNSLTIPPSGRNRVSSVKEWDYEIWFAPGKKIKRKNAIEQASKLLRSSGAQESLRLGVLTTVGSTMATQVANGMTITSLEGQMYVQSLLVSMIAVTLTPYIVEKASSIFKSTIYLDTAFIPEVIYHEYAHVALAKHLRPSHHSAIIEGMANFFAADIGNTDTILEKTRGFSKGLDKLNASKKIMFDSWMEDRSYAQYGFTFGLLYDIQKNLGEEDGRKLIYLAHQKLNASSDIRYDLLNVLEEAAREQFGSEGSQKVILALSRIWQERGL